MKSKNQELLSRIQGGLLGLACGNALGAPIEHLTRDHVEQHFGTVTEMVGGADLQPGQWTQDTAMALCVAEGLLENPQDPIAAIGHCFLEGFPSVQDGDGIFAESLTEFQRQGDWSKASRSASRAREGQATGNGSLARALPVALAYSDPRSQLMHSARVSAMTHWHPQAELCCAIYCLWINELLAGEERYKGWRKALRWARDYEKGGALAMDTPGPTPLPEDFWSRLENVTDLAYKDLQPSGHAGYCLECLEAAAWCAIFSDGAEQAIVDAVNLAGESETLGAVTGGVVGVHWGAAELPASWLQPLHERHRLENLAERLTDLRTGRR